MKKSRNSKSSKRHIGVTLESMDSKLDLVLEAVVKNTEDIEIIKDNICNIKNDSEITKVNIEFIKNDLKQKVGRDEFVLLEKRVSQLEKELRK
jgi:hypothetical protein